MNHVPDPICPRCCGWGKVYDEVFEGEWSQCPYFDFERRVECNLGTLVPMAERIEVEMSGERVRVELPRCGKRDCRHRVKDVLAKYCPACGAPLPGKEAEDG